MASADADDDRSPRNNNGLTSYSVIFQDFSERVPVHDHTISFSYRTLSQSVPQYGDWIGLFKGGRTNPKICDYVSYIEAKDGAISLNNNSYKVSLLLSHSEELDVNAFYQLIYVTMDCSVLGCSQRFLIRDGFCIVEDTSLSAVSTPACESCQHNSKYLDTCSNDSSDNICNVSQNSSSESLQVPHIESRDFAAHGRLAFHNLSEWLAFMSNANRQKKKLHKAPVKVMDELWHTDPKVISKRKYDERSDYTKASNDSVSSINFSMRNKNSVYMSESKKNYDQCDETDDSELTLKSDVEGEKVNDGAQIPLFGTKDCMDSTSSTSENKLRRLVPDDSEKKPLVMIGETCSKDQNVYKSTSADLVLSEKLKAQSSSSSVEIFMEAVHADDAFNLLYLKLDESEGKLKSLAEELRLSTQTIESQDNEIKQYKTILNLQAGELKRHSETIQSQSLMLFQYQEKMEVQLNDLKNLRERTESSISELKEEKEENKLLTKELEEVNGRIKLQSSELDMRCIELHSFKALVDTLSKELNEVREQEITRSSEILLLKEKLEIESSNLKRLRDRDILESADLQCLRVEGEAKSAELKRIKDKDESKSTELKLLQDHLHMRSVELSSLKATVESQSLELMQLRNQVASLTVQVDTDKAVLGERRTELEAKEEEIKQRKQKEELLSMELDQYQTNRESLLAEIKLKEGKEKQMQDELKNISDALQLCRADEMQFRIELNECRMKEEMMLTELTQLRAEKRLVSDEMDQLKATKEFLLSEMYQSKSSYEQLLEEFRKYKMSQQQTSSAYSRAKINMELLSRELEKLRTKEECSSDELKKSNERLKAISDELMLSRKREENLLGELVQLGASGKALLSALLECHTREEELLKRLSQQKVINNTLSPELHQALVNGKLISKEMSLMADSEELLATELEQSNAYEVEFRSQVQQSKLQAEALAGELQQSLASLKLISEGMKMTQKNRKSLAAELEKSKVKNLLETETECIGLAADQEKSLTRQVTISNEMEQRQMNRDALIIELEQSKANEERLYSNLLESKVKQDAFMAEIMQTRAKSIADKKELVTRSEVFVQDKEHTVNVEDRQLNLKLLIENERRLSTELRQCKVNEELLPSELKQSKANGEMMSTKVKKYKTTEDLLSAELKECKATKARFSAEITELKAELEKSKINEEILSTKLKEYRVKEEMLSADLKKSKTNEEILMAELKQSKANEERLSSELNECRGRQDSLSADLKKIRANEEELVAELKNYKEREDMLSAELNQYKISEGSLSAEFKHCNISGSSLSNKLEEYEMKEMLSAKLEECKTYEELVSTELKKSKANEEMLSAEFKEYKVKDNVFYAGLKQYKTSEDMLAKYLKQCKAKEQMISANFKNNETSEDEISSELKKFKSSEERLSPELKLRKGNDLLLSGEINQLRSSRAYEPTGLLLKKTKRTTSQGGLVQEVTAGRCQKKKRGRQAFEEVSQSTNGEEVSASPKSQAHYKLSHLAIIEQLQKRITAQSEEILQYREKIQMLLYKNLLSITQNWSVCEDLTQTGVKVETLESILAQSDVARRGNQKGDVLFVQLRKEQEFRENLFALHDLKNKELFRQIAVLNNLVITSQHEMENIFQLRREPAKNIKIEDTSKLVQENDLAQNAMNHCCLPSRLCKFRSDSSGKAYTQADQRQQNRNQESRSKGCDGAETRMAGKLEYRQSRSVDFQKCATAGRKENKLSATFNSRMMNNIEASLKKLDICQNSDDEKNQMHMAKSVAFNGAEIDNESISAENELVPSAEALESCKVTRRGGQKHPSLSPSPKTLPHKFSGLKGKPLVSKKAMHTDNSKVHCPDQLLLSTTSQLGPKECSQRCPTGLFFSEKSATTSRPKANKLRPDMPSKITIKHLQSPSKIPMTTNFKYGNRFVKKVANNQKCKMKGLNTACCSIVQHPVSAALNDCDTNSQDKRAYTTLKHLKENMDYFFDSMVEVYPDKISLDVVGYSSADNLAQDEAFSSHLQASNKTNLCQSDPDFQQRNEVLPDSFPISSEILSVLTSQFVKKLRSGRSEILDKCDTGIGPNCESKASPRQLAALMFPIGQSGESSDNLNAGGSVVSTACRSVPESNPNNKSSSVSLCSDSVESSVHESKSTITPKAQNKKYPVQNDSQLSSRPSLVSKQKPEPVGRKRPWCSSSKSQSLRPRGDAINGRKGGLGYACSSSIQKKLSSLNTDQSQAKTGSKCKNPRLLAPKPLLLKPVKGKGGYAAMAKKVTCTVDGKSQNFQKSIQQILPVEHCKANVEMGITMEKKEQWPMLKKIQ